MLHPQFLWCTWCKWSDHDYYQKGKEGKPTVNLKASWGVTSRAFPRYNTVNAKEFMEATFEGYKNYLLDDGETDSDAREIAAGDLIPTLGGYNPFNVSNDQLIDPTTGRVNSNAQLLYQDDWMDEATKDSPLRQEYQFSVSGGNSNTNYNFSLGYLNEDGLAVNTGFERFSGRMNIDSQIKKWLKLVSPLLSQQQHKITLLKMEDLLFIISGILQK